MHIRTLSQTRPAFASTDLTLLGKIQQVSATVVAIRQAVDAFSKSPTA